MDIITAPFQLARSRIFVSSFNRLTLRSHEFLQTETTIALLCTTLQFNIHTIWLYTTLAAAQSLCPVSYRSMRDLLSSKQ